MSSERPLAGMSSACCTTLARSHTQSQVQRLATPSTGSHTPATPTPPGFVDKNNDLLYRSLKEAGNASGDPIVREVFPESELESQKRPPTVSVG